MSPQKRTEDLGNNTNQDGMPSRTVPDGTLRHSETLDVEPDQVYQSLHRDRRSARRDIRSWINDTEDADLVDTNLPETAQSSSHGSFGQQTHRTAARLSSEPSLHGALASDWFPTGGRSGQAFPYAAFENPVGLAPGTGQSRLRHQDAVDDEHDSHKAVVAAARPTVEQRASAEWRFVNRFRNRPQALSPFVLTSPDVEDGDDDSSPYAPHHTGHERTYGRPLASSSREITSPLPHSYAQGTPARQAPAAPARPSVALAGTSLQQPQRQAESSFTRSPNLARPTNHANSHGPSHAIRTSPAATQGPILRSPQQYLAERAQHEAEAATRKSTPGRYPDQDAFKPGAAELNYWYGLDLASGRDRPRDLAANQERLDQLLGWSEKKNGHGKRRQALRQLKSACGGASAAECGTICQGNCEGDVAYTAYKKRVRDHRSVPPESDEDDASEDGEESTTMELETLEGDAQVAPDTQPVGEQGEPNEQTTPRDDRASGLQYLHVTNAGFGDDDTVPPPFRGLAGVDTSFLTLGDVDMSLAHRPDTSNAAIADHAAEDAHAHGDLDADYPDFAVHYAWALRDREMHPRGYSGPYHTRPETSFLTADERALWIEHEEEFGMPAGDSTTEDGESL